MGEITGCSGALQLQRMVRCNETLRFLLHLHEQSTRQSCTCTSKTPSKGGATGRPAERNSKDCQEDTCEPCDAANDRSTRYQSLIAAIKLLEEDLHAEKQRAARHRSRRVCADVLRFFLFLLGICAIIAVYPAC